MAKDIFFSYGHDEHKEFVLKVRDFLEKEGFDVFIDNDKLHEGKDWEYTLEQGIYEYEKVVFFITPHSSRRPKGYCLNELALALYLQKEIIPVMLEPHTPPLSIIRLQFLDALPFREKKVEDFSQKLIEILRKEKELDYEGIYFDIQQKLQPIDFTQDFKIHKKIIGRKWIIEKIDKWLENESDSKIFWITAEAGYGKSAITTYLARKYEKVDAVHFCNHNMPSKNNPINIIKTLAYSFQTQIDGYYEQIKHINNLEQKNEHELFESLILNPLEKLAKPNRVYLFVIDALDEAIYEKENRLASLIAEEFEKLPPYVKIVITSRPDPRLAQELSQFEPYVLDAENEQNREDIREYIDYILKQKKLEGHSFDNNWKNALIQKSEANMLYLNRFFEDAKTIEEIENPDNLPKSLNGIYKRYFKRLIKNTDIYRQEYAPIFEVMITYGQAIPKATLASILDIDEVDLSYLLNRFGTLLTFEDDLVDFYHKSLMDWLIFNKNTTYKVNKLSGFKRIIKYIKKLLKNNQIDDSIKLFDVLWHSDMKLSEMKIFLNIVPNFLDIFETMKKYDYFENVFFDIATSSLYYGFQYGEIDCINSAYNILCSYHRSDFPNKEKIIKEYEFLIIFLESIEEKIRINFSEEYLDYYLVILIYFYYIIDYKKDIEHIKSKIIEKISFIAFQYPYHDVENKYSDIIDSKIFLKKENDLQNKYLIKNKKDSISWYIKMSNKENKESKPKRNEPCPCGSGKKYKKCCGSS